MADRSADDVFADYIETMGDSLGRIHHALYKDLTWVHMRWRMFRQLYETPERVELLNKTAPAFFRSLQMVLFEDVILELARLTDSPRSVGKANLSLRRLPSLIDDVSLRTEVEAVIGKAVAECAFARDWRHRRLAHRDLEYALNPEESPLLPASRAAVENALSACRAVLNRIDLHFRDATVGYEHSVIASGDGDSLAYYLEAGLEHEKARRADRLSARGLTRPQA